jgi:hypothetical protein
MADPAEELALLRREELEESLRHTLAATRVSHRELLEGRRVAAVAALERYLAAEGAAKRIASV